MVTRTLFPVPVILAVGLAASLTLTGCGADTPESAASASSASPTTTVQDEASEQLSPEDIAFLEMMIPHHGQALQMTDLVPGRAESPEVVALATQIAAAQDPEIATMQELLRQAGRPVPDPTSTDALHSGHAHSDVMAGMLSAEEMADLEASRGHDFDHLFLTGMIAHHEGAVEMAQERLAASTSPAIRDLAAQIDATQRAEIRRMKALDLELSQHEGH